MWGQVSPRSAGASGTSAPTESSLFYFNFIVFAKKEEN